MINEGGDGGQERRWMKGKVGEEGRTEHELWFLDFTLSLLNFVFSSASFQHTATRTCVATSLNGCS